MTSLSGTANRRTHTLRPYPDVTLPHVLRLAAAERPDHVGLWFKDSSLTYGELDRAGDAAAAALVAGGVRPVDRVALLFPNMPQAVIAQFGVWRAGAIAVPLNPLYSESELQSALVECGATAIVALSQFAETIERVQAHVSSIRHVMGIAADDMTLKAFAGDSLSTRHLPSVSPADPALMLFTGGTTGIPKAAVGTHGAIVQSAIQTHTWFRELITEWIDTVMLAMPLYHIYGNIGTLATSLIGQNPVVLIPNPRDLDDLIARFEQRRPAFLPVVPALLTALLNHPRVAKGSVDFSCLKVCVSGGSSLLNETRRRFEAISGARVVDAYSLTEAMNAAVISPVSGPRKEGAVGLPLPDVEIRIADPGDSSRHLAPGEIGEVTLRAPQLMSGYWNRAADTSQAIRHGWLHTGDIGFVDDEGFLFLVDRFKDLIKPGGQQVWPREVEEVLATHPAVLDVAVAGTRDERGEAVKAWVVARGGQQPSVEELQSHCHSQLAGFKVPRYFAFCDALPRSHAGKVLRRALQQTT